MLNANTSARFETVTEVSDFSIQVSPNPARDIFTVQIRTNNNSKAELIIRDVFGRTMERMMVNDNYQIRIGAVYAPGIYFVELIQGNEKRITRIVKLSK